MASALANRRIVVPETRELDLFVGMLERQGAIAIRCPMVSIHDVQDAGPVEAWVRRLAAGMHDDLVLFTGEGVTRLFRFAERAGLEQGLVEGLRRARKIVRGPKPTRALRGLGITPDLTSDTPTTGGLIAALSKLDLAGRCVGIQTYPDSPSTLLDFLSEAGARADPVLCYRYASQEQSGQVAGVIRALAAGEVDLIAFTSTPQLRRLQGVARAEHLEEQLDAGLRRTPIAAVGPVTAAAVEEAGWRPTIIPQSTYHLKPFVAEIANAFRTGPKRGMNTTVA